MSKSKYYVKSIVESILPALGALAAYNMGTEKMDDDYDNVDDHTTGGDYSNDVTARAQYYEEHLF